MGKGKDKGKSKGKKKDGDPLKMYSAMMAFLILVMGGLWFMIERTRKNYEGANQKLVGLMRFEGSERDAERRPTSVPDLAWEV